MIRIIVAVFLATLFFDGTAQKNKQPEGALSLFSVGNEPTSTEEFIYLYKKNHQTKDDFTQQKIEEYLKLYINFKLKVKEARHRGIDTSTVFLKEYNAYKEELKKPYLPEGKLIDSLVKVTYARLQEEVRVSHILFSVKPDASPADTLRAYKKSVEIKNKALSGEDFGSLAALYSEEPMAQTTKGDLDYFTAMQMVYPFENAAYLAKKGEIVGPVRSLFGYHILKIEDRKPSRGEVEVSHIMIRTGAEHDATKSKNLIFEIYDQLKGGVVWEELCKQYSEDPATKNTGGRLRPFGVRGMASVPAFDRVAFALQKPGDISDPFQTQYGWHIVRLERKIPLPSFDEIAVGLKGRVARDERTQISKQAFLKKIKRDFSFTENSEVKAKVFALADSSLVKGKWGWKETNTRALNDKSIFTLSSKPVLALDFLKYVKEMQKPNSQTATGYIDQLYNAFVEKTINQKLENEIIRSNPDFEMLLKEYYDGILLFDIMEEEVWKKASDDSLGQRKYFNANAKKYFAGERIDAVIYTSGNGEVISSVMSALQKSDTIGIQKLVQTKAAKRESGLFQKGDRPIFSQVDWKPGIYTFESNRMYYLVEVKRLVSAGPMSFEESRAMVISEYQDHLEKEWLKVLEKKYPVKINEKAKKHVVEKLKS